MSKIVRFANDDFYRRRAKQLLENAIVAFGDQEYEVALDEIEVAKRLDEKNAEIYFYSAIIKSLLELDGAVEDHKKAVDLEPKNSNYKLWYGISLFSNNKNEEARDVLEELYYKRPEEPKAKLYFLRTLMRLEEFTKVINLLNGLQVDYLSTKEMELLGVAFYETEEYDNCLYIFEEKIPQEKLKTRSYHYICDSYIQLGKYDEAIEFLDKLSSSGESGRFVEKYRESIEFLKKLEED